jgi:hypothetical protein
MGHIRNSRQQRIDFTIQGIMILLSLLLLGSKPSPLLLVLLSLLGRNLPNLSTHRIGLPIPFLSLGLLAPPLQLQSHDPIDVRTHPAMHAIRFNCLGILYHIFSVKHVRF